MRSARIVYHATGLGLINDAMLLAAALRRLGIDVMETPRRGCRVCRVLDRVTDSVRRGPVGGLFRRARGTPRRMAAEVVDVNFFLERAFPAFVPFARRNVLIPNPEWFEKRWIWHLGLVDAVFCKSNHAVGLFRQHTPAVERIGFTSRDRSGSTVRPCHPADARWLHVASAGLNKGTAAVLQAWQAHPHWPGITVLQSRRPALGRSGSNVNYRAERVDDEQLVHLMSGSSVHLCPSEAEGFGHSIVEAMSCAALVLTTDAPPMNELVQEDRGVLIPAAEAVPQRCGEHFRVSATALAASVERVLGMNNSAIEHRRAAARLWYEDNNRQFEKRLAVALRNL